MAVHARHTDPNVFGFGILIPKKHYNYVKEYKKELSQYTDWFVNRSPKSKNEIGMHITIKYLGCQKDFEDRYMLSKAPELRRFCRIFLPIEITVSGIGAKRIKDKISIFLKFKPKEKLRKFHNAVSTIEGIDHFLDIDGKNYDPHIAIATAEWSKENWKRINDIIRKHKNKETVILCRDAYLFLKKKGAVVIYKSAVK